MYYRIIDGKLIQLSDNKLDGYEKVIEEEILPEKEGYYVAYDYVIVDDTVHKTYHYEEIVEESDKGAEDENNI